jgi:hypothetical protein
MLGAKALNLTFQELALDRRSAFMVALHDEQIFQTGDRLQAKLVVPAEAATQVFDHSL